MTPTCLKSSTSIYQIFSHRSLYFDRSIIPFLFYCFVFIHDNVNGFANEFLEIFDLALTSFLVKLGSANDGLLEFVKNSLILIFKFSFFSAAFRRNCNSGDFVLECVEFLTSVIWFSIAWRRFTQINLILLSIELI